jgi:hypothetical protein
MKYPVGVLKNVKKETVYYIGKGVDIEKLFRSATLENPKYQFYTFPYSQDDDVMLIKKKNRKSWWDDVELTDDVQKMLDIAWDCGRDSVE